MPVSESPQLRWYRVAARGVAVLVCLAAPSVTVLVCDVPGDNRREAVVSLIATGLLGALLPFLFWSPFRALGFVGYVSAGWLAACIYGVATGHWPGWAHGLTLGLVIGAVGRSRTGPEPVEDTYWLVGSVLIGSGAAWSSIVGGRPFDAAGYFVLSIAVLELGWAWLRLFRPLFEITLEPVVWLMYRVYGRGPGLEDFPRTGSCLVIANHACWLDPLFLAKVLPRPVTPMMTSRFYNLPVLHRLMVSFGVISVSEKPIKKEAPEIKEAIAALERGECLVVFPEGYLRRTEEQPLRRFGQGVWKVLQARPETPVFACWIEGGWGSYTSYFNGRPTKNKKPDFRRPVGIGASRSTVVPKDVLAEQMRTRYHLMNLVGAARALLNLPALPLFEVPSKDDGKADESE